MSSRPRGFRPLHWIARFVSSLWPAPLSPQEVAWVSAWLSDPEERLFAKMSRADQRHALGVARAVEPRLDEIVADRRSVVMAAAVLHDVGKTAAGLGTYGRSVATMSGLVGGYDMAEVWQDRSGFTRRVGLYLRYGDLGADMLRLAGSDPWVVAWSVEHHLPAELWSIPIDVGEILAEADH